MRPIRQHHPGESDVDEDDDVEDGGDGDEWLLS